MSKLAGKKAVVTGGTHGMGLGIVQALVAGGAEVVFTGRNEKKIEEARSAVDSKLAHVVRSDAASMADIDALGTLVEEKLGRVDYLFVNHGLAEIAPVQEMTEEMWDRAFAINTKGAFFTVKRLDPLLNDEGAIVFTTVSNDTIFPGLTAYSGSKEAVTAIAQVLAAEYLPRRIRVNTLAPGYIDTPSMGVPGMSAEEREAFMKQGDETTPFKRHGTIEEIATAALFLAVDATYTTGVELAVDGGFAQGLGS
ncbi:SDR family oxidoreductase [Streptomyces marincola]|uniref:SDR family oxidoreductase n=1 Tax=Streptomyces marincola TaxID=2878388 RepID=UPI001CF30D18|nr:SDR family oxidoreductase [Streptomyces marincola]UCM87580.1 SDR family oxidoreductase [Streptomyces marincola]